jgi:MFS transporter, DHA1 family, solute carrier family 18 (vesicular amine transporter), member 1/2
MRRSALMLYLGIFVGEVVWTALVPLVPTYSQRFNLSKLESGMLLASASLTILAVSIPASVLGDRFGPRRLTLWAMALMAASDLGTGLAGSFWQLLLARMAFGIAFGIVWTTGVAWLGEVAGAKQARALSLTVTTAGLGGITGPGFAGIAVQRYGLATPFVASAALTALVFAAMATTPSGTGQRPATTVPLTQTIRNAAGERLILVSLLLMSLGGFIGGAVNLLAPLQLHRNGMSASLIGLVFSIAALTFIASSAMVARFGERAASVRVGWLSAALIALALTVVVASHSTAAVVGFLLARGPVSALMFTITFPLGVVGARRAGISLTAIAALLNIVWSASALVGPIAAGALAQATSARATYLCLIVAALASAVWMARSQRAADTPQYPADATACRAAGR